MKFSDLGLNEAILRAITAAGYNVPTPIQAKAIPHILAGKDVLGCAQTGTGKTAAFCLPMAQRLMDSAAHHATAPEQPQRAPGDHTPGHGARGSHRAGNSRGHHGGPRRPIRALILSPTRELTLQIAENLAIYAKNSKLRHTVIFGGVGQGPQVRDLQSGVDIVVATPGRLEDLMQQGYVDLRHVEMFILDEADRMLDMGFIQPIRRIAAAVPKQRQTLLLSATMPREIRHLADSLLTDPVSVEVAPAASLPTLIEQSVFQVSRGDKPALLSHLLKTTSITRALVFTRTKHGADKVVKRLAFDGIHAEAIHGNKRQNVRQRTLANFKSGRTPVLVATDIAARGIDVDEVSHVINYELPNEPETYVHRIGRTGRAGMTGVALSFCDHEERSHLRSIEKLVKRPIEVLVTPDVPRDTPAQRSDRQREDAHEGRAHAPRDHRNRSHHEGPHRERREDRRGGHGQQRHSQSHPHPHARPAHGPRPDQRSGTSRPAAPHPAPAKPSSHRKGPPPSNHGNPAKPAGRRGQPGHGFRGKPRADRQSGR